MKRFLSLLFTLTFIFGSSYAEVVRPEVALSAAKNVMAVKCAGFQAKDATITEVREGNTVCMYVCNFKPEGWALIAADDAMSPLLGYSATGTFVVNDLPINLEAWMDSHKAFVCELKDAVRKSGKAYRNTDWDRMLDAEQMKPSAATRASGSVSPLIEVHWNQNGAYNAYCPSDNDGRALVGCVAVGMAQAMSVPQYPERPVGYAQYNHDKYGSLFVNYDKEPDYNWADIMSGANNKDEVARLLYHCGISVSMDYGVSGSGAISSKVASALLKYFSYPQSVKHYSRGSIPDEEYKKILLDEISHGRAVVYHGYDSKGNYGHCFNLDGTDGANFFHVNWGWGGSNDGFFPIDGLKDNTMHMDYTDSQGMIVGIRRPSVNPSDIQLSNKTVTELQPAGTIVGTIVVESEAQNPTYSFVIKGPYSPILHRYVAAPFEVRGSNLVTTKELKISDAASWDITITATNVDTQASYSKEFMIQVVSSTGIEEMSSETNNLPLGIYDMSGKKVAESLSELPTGVKGVFVENNTEGTRKVIIQ